MLYEFSWFCVLEEGRVSKAAESPMYKNGIPYYDVEMTLCDGKSHLIRGQGDNHYYYSKKFVGFLNLI